MITINPWINFNGNAEEAFEFYQSVFGGEIKRVLGDDGAMMFIHLPIGANNMLIANNVPAELGRVSENENRSKIAVSAETKEQADQIFTGLSAEGSVEMPMSEGMGTYMGMFRDKYGIEWIIEFAGK